MAASIWIAHPLRFTLLEDRALAHCSNVTVCRATLPVSHEDAAERSIPQVEGWRTTTHSKTRNDWRMREGKTYAFCGECSHEHLPKEGF